LYSRETNGSKKDQIDARLLSTISTDLDEQHLSRPTST
jgi:hypothetical protein